VLQHLFTRADTLWLAVTPALFVILWSTGFIGARLAMPHADPLTFLSVRFLIAAALLGALALALKVRWPENRRVALHLAVAGILIHAIYLGGVFIAVSWGTEAGMSALIVSMSPLLVAAASGPLLDVAVTRQQWAGFALGFVGVALVVSDKLELGGTTPAGIIACLLSLAGIAAGTLYQKRFCADMNLISGACIQYSAAAMVALPCAFVTEPMHLPINADTVIAMIWLVFVLSIGAVMLLYLLIRRGAAHRVSSLFYLVPPSTAILAYFLFGETLSGLALVGMGIAVVGVALVRR